LPNSRRPVPGLHIDLDRLPGQIDDFLATIKTTIILSIGLVSGHDIWKNIFMASIKIGQKALDALGADRVVATSSSRLHTLITLATETKLTSEQKDWISFILENTTEVASSLLLSLVLKTQLSRPPSRPIFKRQEFEGTSDCKRVDHCFISREHFSASATFSHFNFFES
jgi:5-methyltetrahydropteroyltriglutamate--homocysteine methyltransferase